MKICLGLQLNDHVSSVYSCIVCTTLYTSKLKIHQYKHARYRYSGLKNTVMLLFLYSLDLLGAKRYCNYSGFILITLGSSAIQD